MGIGILGFVERARNHHFGIDGLVGRDGLLLEQWYSFCRCANMLRT